MASYTGLATGAGAAGGLETLLARMRAEEMLANQGRQIDIDKFEAESADATRRGQLDLGGRQLGEETRQFDEQAPNRIATAALNTAGARESGVRSDTGEESLSVLRGLRPYLGGADAGADPNALNNPLGRIRLSAAGIEPNSAFGPVDTSNTSDEQWFDSYFERLNGLKPGQGVGRGRELTFEQRQEAAEMKPQTMIAQSNLNIRSSESKLRQQKQQLDIREAEMKIQQDEKIPPAMRPFLLAEFRNRMQNDIQTRQTWIQWLNGEDVADPSAQIAQIFADVMSKAGQIPAAAPGTAPAGAPRRRFDRQGNPVQ